MRNHFNLGWSTMLLAALPIWGCGSSDVAGGGPSGGSPGVAGALGSSGALGAAGSSSTGGPSSGGSDFPGSPSGGTSDGGSPNGNAGSPSGSAGLPSGGTSNAGGRSGGAGGRSGGAGGSGSAGTSGTTGGQAGGGGMVDPGPCKPRPVDTKGDVVFYCSGVAQWEIYDMAVYTKYKTNFDEIIKLLDQGYAAIIARTGPTTLSLPIQVVIGKDTCCGGWAAGGTVGYNDGNFQSDTGMDWVRGVVLGEVVNAVTGTFTDNWPSDWWVNSVWYFPGFMAVDVLREVAGPERATKWETTEKYPTYPIYNLFLAIKNEKTFSFYQTFFASITKDKMAWAKIGTNPSAIKTNYVIAYLSLAYGANLGPRFITTGKANGTDTTVIQGIMDAHAKLVAADPTGASAAWGKFRTGDYAGAASGL